jgi:large subunit ribosomal protein L21
MYAVIKTGGKQYTVRAGDLLVVEKLDGEPGANVTFGDVLLVGDGDKITVGAPMVSGVTVAGTLIETRKGEKIKIFKKIRRQGYRRTGGHRQIESVVRVTAVGSEKWDGKIDLTPKALINARARGLKNLIAELEGTTTQAEAAPAKKAAAPKTKAVISASEAATPVILPEAAPEAEAPKAKKAAAPKAEAPKVEAKAEAKPAAKAKAAAPKTEAAKAPAKKPAAKKTDK